MVSPSWTRCARLARSPLTSILPPSTACAAAERVLKKRAAHSHLSRRTRVGTTGVGADDMSLNPCDPAERARQVLAKGRIGVALGGVTHGGVERASAAPRGVRPDDRVVGAHRAAGVAG